MSYDIEKLYAEIGALKARLIKVEAENKKASKWCDRVVAEKERLTQETPAYIQQYNAALQAYQETRQVGKCNFWS